MKLVNLFELKYSNEMDSSIVISDIDQGFQLVALKNLSEDADIQLQPIICYPQKNWNYDEEEKTYYGLMKMDFKTGSYEMVMNDGILLFSENKYLYFRVPGEKISEFKIVRHHISTEQCIYSELFPRHRYITYFAEKHVFYTKKYIVLKIEKQDFADEYHILDKHLNKAFVYQMKQNCSLNFFYVTEECIYIGESQEIERYVTAIKLDSFDIKEKRIEPFFDYQSEEDPIMYSSTTVGDKLCLSHTENINGKWYETRKIINADLEIEQQYCFVQPLESRFLTADTDTAESLELWFMRTAEGLKIFYTLVDCMTGQNLWELNLGAAGYDTAGWGIKPEFWKDYIVFSAFEKGKKGNGVLVINRTNGQVEFYKKVKDDIRKIIPREDGVYIQSVSSRKYTYYYKLLES